MTAGCATVEPDSMASPAGSATATRQATASPSASPTPTPSVTPSPSAARLPTRATIVTKYGKLRPHEWGLETTGVVLRQKSSHVCLTFDACGGPYGSTVDADLLAMLRKHKVKTTLFLNQRWITANPALARELADDPLFDLQNHGTKHLPLSVSGRKGYAEQGTHNAGEVYDEVAGNISTLTKLTGRAPRFFRSGTAHMDEVAARIVRELGQLPVNFSINGDAGTTFTRNQIIQEMSAARPGDIVIGHMNQPHNATAEGMAVAVPRLLERGITFAHLSEVL